MPGGCMEHFAQREKERAAKENYRADMDLLAFIREGGTQAEYARQHGVTRQRVHQWMPKAIARTQLAHQLILDGTWSPERDI